ncbi:hypothetical protein FQR65_LT03491 [Abscondita terminalis]|nr:hypothetical protein FQR65_LT03491 [Abscondita terminalis]
MFRIVFFVTCATILESSGKLLKVSRIVGGKDADPNEFPFMASLQINGRHLCGGTIINNNTVLTAAHCIEKNMTVVVGTSDLRKDGVRFDVARTIPHPKFTNFNYDVALVKIVGFFTFGPKVSQILLNGNRVEKETPCTAYGWGRLNATTSTSPSLKYIKLR